jgi:hypothetical protein
LVHTEEDVVLRERAEGLRDYDKCALRLFSRQEQLGSGLVLAEKEMVLRGEEYCLRYNHHK